PAIVRVEQLYPLPSEQLQSVLDSYPDAELTWVQEEPQNQGAWSFMAMNFAVEVGRTLRVVARPASASPATGSNATHKVEQEELLSRAFEARSEEHTSELQSRFDLVCRLLLAK